MHPEKDDPVPELSSQSIPRVIPDNNRVIDKKPVYVQQFPDSSRDAVFCLYPIMPAQLDARMMLWDTAYIFECNVNNRCVAFAAR